MSNIGYEVGLNGRPPGTWHWIGTPARRLPVYIPPAANLAHQNYASKVFRSIALINDKLSGVLVLEAVNALPASGSYMHVSYDTAYVPSGYTATSGFCANVSTGPRLGNVMVPDSDNGVATIRVYINLGNGRCDVTDDIVTHEFGHALGLGEHFDGFGANGSAPISSTFWDVLATLYGNPRSTQATELIVKRAP